MPDKTLVCRDCGTSFEFTTGEQEFFASKGFTNEPSRCQSCRGARNSNRDGRSGGGGGGFGGGGSYGGYGRQERQMFPAVCAQCGKDTQVPFQPRGDRPVYCSECFQSQRGSASSSGRSNW